MEGIGAQLKRQDVRCDLCERGIGPTSLREAMAMLEGRCPKCGSSEVYRSQAPGGIWNGNDDKFLLGVWTNAGHTITDDWHTCTCTACGYCEFYLNDPRVLAEIAGAPPGKVWGAPPGQPWSKIVPAGWLADPSGRHELRYWDGRQWTASVSDGGEQSQDPLSP